MRINSIYISGQIEMPEVESNSGLHIYNQDYSASAWVQEEAETDGS